MPESSIEILGHSVGGVAIGILIALADVTQILTRIEQGDPTASEQLLPLVYDQLRRNAAARLAEEKPGQALQATALVHDAYIRLVGAQGEPVGWNSRGHFYAAAAEAMRRILIERARKKQRAKHGGGRFRTELDFDALALNTPAEEIIALDEALSRLEAEHPSRAAIVKLKHFGGLTTAEAAKVMGVSLATAERQWRFARTRLYTQLTDDCDSKSQKL